MMCSADISLPVSLYWPCLPLLLTEISKWYSKNVFYCQLHGDKIPQFCAAKQQM